MSHHDRDIDALLRRSAERQLEEFDWERLSRDINSRLAAKASARPWSQCGKWVAVAAAVVLTAGVLIYAVICLTGSDTDDSAPGSATVVIAEAARPTGAAQVSFPPVQATVRCEVQILPSGKEPAKDAMRASWCIIAKHELPVDEHGSGHSDSDVVCLF